MTESPDSIHGRMKEGAHLAGYGLQRSMANLKWLLEEARWSELSEGYANVNDFLRDTAPAFKLLAIDPTERKEIAQLVKAAEPEASQRAIADMVGVADTTIGEDLGTLGRDRHAVKTAPDNESQAQDMKADAVKTAPWTSDNFDPGSAAENAARREQRAIEREDRLAEDIAAAEGIPDRSGLWQLIEGDFRTTEIEPESVSAVITDPPYPEKYLELYAGLGEFADRVLVPGGSLLALVGQAHLPEVLHELSMSLRYHWTLSLILPGPRSIMYQRKVNVGWKPVVWFVKDKYARQAISDTISNDAMDKDRFHWQQGVGGFARLVADFTRPGDLVVDPMCGTSTTGIAAIGLGRRYIGIDNDPDRIANSKARLAGG